MTVILNGVASSSVNTQEKMEKGEKILGMEPKRLFKASFFVCTSEPISLLSVDNIRRYKRASKKPDDNHGQNRSVQEKANGSFPSNFAGKPGRYFFFF